MEQEIDQTTYLLSFLPQLIARLCQVKGPLRALE
jgi:hypothetical protein